MGTQAKLGAQVTFIKQVTYKRRISSPVVQAVVEVMEQRRLLSVVTLDGTHGIDQYCIRLNPADSTQVQFFRGNGPDELIESHPAADVESVQINGYAGDDVVTLDASNGVPLNSVVLTFNGGEGIDSIQLIGQSALAVSFAPAASQGGGSVSVQDQSFDYTGVENLSAVAFSSATLTTPSGPNALVITKNGEGAIVLVGQSGGTSLPVLSLRGVGSLTVDTAANQPTDSVNLGDSIILTGSADPSWFSGLTLQLGTGQNTLDISAAQSTVTTSVESPGTLNVRVSGNAQLDVLGSQRFDSLTLTEAGVVRLAGDASQVLNLGQVEKSQWAIVDAGVGDIEYDPLPEVSSAADSQAVDSEDETDEQAGGGMMQMDSGYGAQLYMTWNPNNCIHWPTLPSCTDNETLDIYWGLSDPGCYYEGWIIQHVIMYYNGYGEWANYWEIWPLETEPLLSDSFIIPTDWSTDWACYMGWAMYFPPTYNPGFDVDDLDIDLSYGLHTSRNPPAYYWNESDPAVVYHDLVKYMNPNNRSQCSYQCTDPDTNQLAQRVYAS
jgi:hypothetical protein